MHDLEKEKTHTKKAFFCGRTTKRGVGVKTTKQKNTFFSMIFLKMTRTSWNTRKILKNCMLFSVLVYIDQQKKLYIIFAKYLEIFYSLTFY